MSESDQPEAGSEHGGPDVPVEVDGNPTVTDSPRSRRWWLVTAAGVLVLVVAGAAVYWQVRPRPSAAASDQFVSVGQQTLKQTVSATGTIEPAQESELSFSSSGTVTGVDVAVGDKVKKGEKLATMDDSSLKAAVDSDRAALEASQDNLNTLADNSDSTDTALASAKADVKLKKSELAQAKDALQGATLKAPFSGVVAAVGISVGDDAGGSSNPGSSGSSGAGGGTGSSGGSGSTSTSSASSSSSESITVISTDEWTVSTAVGGTDLASVKKGLQAQVTPSGATDPVFGTVETVGVMASSSDSGSSSFPVTIKITGSPSGLHAGESADVSIIVKQLSNALVVPTMAVRTVNGQAVVDKKSGNGTVQTKITIGDTYGFYTQVKSGLAPGDQVKVSVAPRAAGGSGGAGSGSISGSGTKGGFGGGRFGGVGGGSGGGGFPGGPVGGFGGGQGGGRG